MLGRGSHQGTASQKRFIQFKDLRGNALCQIRKGPDLEVESKILDYK